MQRDAANAKITHEPSWFGPFKRKFGKPTREQEQEAEKSKTNSNQMATCLIFMFNKCGIQSWNIPR